LRAIERLESSPDGPHLRIYRDVIKQDISKLSEPEDEAENGDKNNEQGEEEGGEEEGEGEGEGEGEEEEDDGTDNGMHPIVFYIYEVWAQKHKKSVFYWIYSVKYSMEDGGVERWCDEQANRTEAIAHVVEARSYEKADNIDQKSDFDWIYKAADEEIGFPTEDDILNYMRVNEWAMYANEGGIGW
jgi:hypothetical protein